MTRATPVRNTAETEGQARPSTGSHLLLFVWLSPSFPVGSFAYSHGLEWAHEAGDVTDCASLREWLSDLLAYGAARNDAVLLAEAHRAARAADEARLRAVAELALALATSSERRLETVTQGEAFLRAIAPSWPCKTTADLRRTWTDPVAYPVAVGVVAAGHCVALADALPIFVLGFVSNLVSAAVRLGVVGQTDGQQAIAALVPTVHEVAAFAEASTLDDLGGAAFRSDLAALRHETQYTRLFRS
jgi:urease accessory protein